VAIIADTSGLLALLDQDEQYHSATVQAVGNSQLWIPSTVLPEVDYEGVPLGLVDSSVVAIAERYKIQQILTLDRRHFSLIHPQGLSHLELLP
jgi:uncharacterized protein